MDIDDDQNEESIPDGAILMIANNILGLLEYSDQLTDEEVLFSDEFYISILSNLLTDKKFEIQPGETSEQKIKNLKKLLKLLSEIIEMDLSQISPEGIIKKHDKYSAKSFLELLEELIKTLMNANLGEEEESDKDNEIKSDKKNKNKEIKDDDDNEEVKNQSYSENDIDNIRKGNNSEGNIFGGNKNKFNLDDEDEEINNYNKNKKGLNKDEEININDLQKEQEKEEEIIKDKSDKKSSNNNSINKDNLDNINNSGDEENRISQESFRRLNQSNIEKLQLEKMLKNYDESYIRKTYSQNDLSAYEKQYAEREEENENEEDNFNENEKKEENEVKIKKDALSSPGEEENKFSDGGLDLNYNLEDKNNLSGSPIMNVSQISELSKSKKEKEKENEIQINSSEKKK